MSRVPDNYDAYNQYERDKERDEYYNNKLSDIKEQALEVLFLLDNYDTEDNADLCNRIELATEKLTNMVDGI